MTMRLAIRADASLVIGSGHVMRCLTLADAMANEGVKTTFLCRDLPGHMAEVIRSHGHSCELLPLPEVTKPDAAPQALLDRSWLAGGQDADALAAAPILERLSPDWVIVDHYALDSRWQKRAKPQGSRLLVIDDLADRPHSADALIDMGAGRHPSEYDPLVPGRCELLIGPRYAPLRPEFTQLRGSNFHRRAGSDLARVLVFMGGMDHASITSTALGLLEEAFADSGVHPAVTVVLGAAALHAEAVRELAAGMPFAVDVISDTGDMAALMAEADISIGAGGTTSWERCCLGLPSVVLAVAPNQIEVSKALARKGAVAWVGSLDDADWSERMTAELLRLCDPETRHAMSERAATVCDGRGTARLVDLLRNGSFRLRLAEMSDAEAVWRWRYADGAERYYRSGEAVKLATHLAWFDAALRDPDRTLLIAEVDTGPVAHVRFDCTSRYPREAVISICLDSSVSGRGAASRVLETARRWAGRNEFATLLAEIHEDHVASRKAFEQSGYRLHSADGVFRCYRLDVNGCEDLLQDFGSWHDRD